ncbi:MAG: DUF3109 family protein, partial [Bacteroidota bacterium]|nr:DUF3109 family protein [Bacteroidota bacterium]
AQQNAAVMAILGFPLIIPQLLLLIRLSRSAFGEVFREGALLQIILLLTALDVLVIVKCKGGCCVDGDAGAPLEKNELQELNDAWRFVLPYLTRESVAELQKQENIIIIPLQIYSCKWNVLLLRNQKEF